MKKLLFILTILLSFNTIAQTIKPCPIQGESKRREDQISDSLKNRNVVSPHFGTLVAEDFLLTGNDVNRYHSTSYVRVRGKIVEVKHGGAELCNCHSTEKLDLDIHIVLADSIGEGNIICEVNRYTQAIDKNLSYAEVHAMIGKQVYIYGWLFFDGEHKQNASNTCTTCTNVWRNTCWEVHPVMKIEIIK